MAADGTSWVEDPWLVGEAAWRELPAPRTDEVLLARNAHRLGLTAKPWVKTSLAPGSRVVSDYLQKAGLLVGHTEAICTGVLAGYNAVRSACREQLLVLPDSLAVGDAIRFVRRQMREEGVLSLKYTFSGSVYFERMKAKRLYTTEHNEIEQRVDAAGLTGVFLGR